MTKSSKIITGLGLVAALGIAIVPASSFAATAQTVSGNVELQAEILPAIAMTIVGNDDVASPQHDATSGLTYGATGFADESPAGSDVDGYSHSNNHEGITSSSYVGITPNTANTATALSTITIYTNNASGYTLSTQAAGATLVKDASNSIASIETADTAPSSSNLGWGFKTAKSTGSGSVTTTTTDFTKWNAVPTSAAQLASSAVKTSSGDSYTVNYGVAVDDSVETGFYKQTITYTATTN